MTDKAANTEDTVNPAWVGVDWGTTSLRGWALDAAGRVLAKAASEEGMGVLPPDRFEDALLDLIGPWLGPTSSSPMPVIACGMVGARQGWKEAAYRAVPCQPLTNALQRVAAKSLRLDVAIIPGLCQTRPVDVMRGEETQIAGYLVDDPGFDGVLCLPGTHTKWVRISAGEVVSFQSCMTGELFALIAKGSVLRHSVQSDEIDLPAFAQAVEDAMTAPHMVTARLFGIRAETLLSGLSASAARARLSGLLIGLELAGTRSYWLGQDVAIVGAGQLGTLYSKALGQAGALPKITDVAGITLNGLRYARKLMQGGQPT